MKPETVERLQGLLVELWTRLGQMSGSNGQEAVIDTIRNFVKDPLSAQFIHMQARKTLPLKELDAIRPEDLYELFALIRSADGQKNLLERLPEELAPKIELQLQEILKKTLPEMRAGLVDIAKRLPHRSGGRPRTMPDKDGRRKICEEILELIGKGYEIQYAQRRLALKWDLSFRTVERIWAQRSELIEER
jgi:hypothetical protein